MQSAELQTLRRMRVEPRGAYSNGAADTDSGDINGPMDVALDVNRAMDFDSYLRTLFTPLSTVPRTLCAFDISGATGFDVNDGALSARMRSALLRDL